MNITINNIEVWANPGETVLEVAEREGIRIPTLCYLKGFSPTGSCRMCMVEVEDQGRLVPSCAFPVYDGMKVKTNSPEVRRARKTIIELLLANPGSGIRGPELPLCGTAPKRKTGSGKSFD